MNIETLKAQLISRYKGIKTLLLTETQEYISLDMIEIDKEYRKQGIGTFVMIHLIRYADNVGKEIILLPGVSDDRKGTTSRGRLVAFYKQFGFVENKGRNKDFTKKGGSMFRKPIKK